MEKSKERCSECSESHGKEDFLDKHACMSCGGRLRPNVVLFGECLPQDAWNKALVDIKKAELVIVIGSSLQVYPVNTLPSLSKGRLVYINNENKSGLEFDLVIEGLAVSILSETDELLKTL